MEKWTSAELNTMIQWHKRPDDAAMPGKKAEKLARYYDIYRRGDPVTPTVMREDTPMLAATLPPAPEPDLAITDADETLDAGEALLMFAYATEAM